MYEWNVSIQRMLDCVEENLTEPLTLEGLAAKLNYSRFYCTRQFHKYAGISLREYIYLRKLAYAVLELRDTKKRVLDIAVKYGFSSQEAFTRSFVKAYGLTPSSYRKMQKPLNLLVRRNVYNPYFLGLGEINVNKNSSKDFLNDVKISIQVLPEHKFIGMRNINADNYFDFWRLQDAIDGLDCHTACGVLESIKSYNGQIGGWYYEGEKKGYLYGIEVSPYFDVELPKGLEYTLVPESLYVVFHHPPYNYLESDGAVSKALQNAVDGWSPEEHGYEYNYGRNPIYQRHNPENSGQGICVPIRIKSK